LFKPTYGVPVAVLMLAQRDWRAVAIGLATAAVLSLAVAGVLVQSAGGVQPFADALLNGYGAWRAESGDPLHTAYRVDAAALVARFLGRSPGMTVEVLCSLTLLALGAAVMRLLGTRSGREGDARALAASIGAVVVLVSVYHLLYDLLLLCLPLGWMMAQAMRSNSGHTRAVSVVAAVLLALPMMNYLASERAAAAFGSTSTLWRAATALNAWTPLLALLLWVGVLLRPAAEQEAQAVRRR
jgi:hypothetical protein